MKNIYKHTIIINNIIYMYAYIMYIYKCMYVYTKYLIFKIVSFLSWKTLKTYDSAESQSATMIHVLIFHTMSVFVVFTLCAGRYFVEKLLSNNSIKILGSRTGEVMDMAEVYGLRNVCCASCTSLIKGEGHTRDLAVKCRTCFFFF